MQYSNALSDFVLAGVSLYVFFRFCNHLPRHQRMAWAAFFGLIATAALVGTLRFFGIEQLKFLHETLTLLGGTVGVAAMLVGVGTEALRSNTLLAVLLGALGVGLVLFLLLFNAQWRPFASVVQSFAMLMAMLLAVYGLVQKNQKMVWIVVGIMIVGVATKVPKTFVPMHPTDVYHYSLAVALYCFGKSIS